MNTPESDGDAVRKIKRGDINWYEVIVKKYASRIHQYVSSKLFDREEADDIVQKTFIHFYRAIERFDETRPVLPYLYEIAKNELKMYYRSRKDTVPLNEKTAGVEEPDPLLDTELESLLQGISPDQRKALTMLAEGYSYKEIASVLKRPLNTVRTLIRRARMLLTIHKKP